MKKAQMLTMMATMNPEDYPSTTTPKKIKKPKKEIIPKGLTQFFYGDNSVWALNQKTADKKATKKGYL